MDEVGITEKVFSQGSSALRTPKLACTSLAGACSRTVFFAAKGFPEKELLFAFWIREWILACIFAVSLAFCALSLTTHLGHKETGDSHCMEKEQQEWGT